jgi:hypothetical protein
MKNKKLIMIIMVLALSILILGYMNIKSIEPKANEEGSITFVAGEKSVKLTFDEITSLSHVEFRATEDTSKSGPTPRKYKGVLLKDALNKASINDEMIANSSKIIVTGLDGYVIALSKDEVLSNNNVYLAFEKDGKPLGTMKKGGSGPFQMIATSDSFSQRWCKYVIEVSLE